MRGPGRIAVRSVAHDGGLATRPPSRYIWGVAGSRAHCSRGGTPVARFRRIDTGAPIAAGSSLLSDAETARLARLRSADDREAFTAAHLLVRSCAAALVGMEPRHLEFVQRCASCGRDGHGRPTIVGHPDVHVSLSHTRGCVAAVAARSPCGIDVETIHRGPPPRGVLTEREAAWVRDDPDPARAFTMLWVRKEALVKAGIGTLAEVGSLDVLDPGSAGVPATMETWADPPYVGAWVVLDQAPT